MTRVSKKSQIISTWGPAESFHARKVGPINRPQIWVHEVSKPTVVLGSTQKAETLDLSWVSSHGYDLVKRRSGGGLVVITPGTSVWIDVVISPNHPLWLDDVGQAFMWVGQAWSRALSQVGLSDLKVHDGPASNPDLGRQLCFGSVGFGEVLAGGSKVVGLSQRRTKHAARFQGIAHQKMAATDLADFFTGELPGLDELQIGAAFNPAELRTAAIVELQRSLEQDI